MKTLQIITVAFTVSLFAAGCMVGPNYHPPQAKVPDQHKLPINESEQAKKASITEQAPVAKWWTTFNDEKLNSLIDRSVQGNLDLRIAQARVREARALRGVVAADLYPTVNASASYERRKISENSLTGGTGDTGGFGIPGLEGDLYQAGFDASWEIDVFGGKRREIEAANADISAEIENRRDVLVTLLSEIARNYVELRGTQRQIAIAQANLKAQQETHELTKVRFDAGLVSDLDVSRARALVETTAAEIPTLQSSARQSIHLLSVLLGQEPNALVNELSTEGVIPPAPPEIPVGLPSELLRRRPDVRRAERQLAGATARIGVATADLFPKFSLTAFLGLASTRIGNFTESNSVNYSILPGVSWPIFDFGRIRSNIAVQNAREEQALSSYEQTVLTSLRDVADALVSFSEEQSRRQSLTEAVAANQRAVELANDLYKQGLSDFLSVLQAQRDLFTSEDALVQSNRDVSSNLVALYKALGGGWEIEAEAIDKPLPGKAGSRTIDVTSGPTKKN